MITKRTTAGVLLAAIIAAATGCGPSTTDAGTKTSADPDRWSDPYANLSAAQIELNTRNATASATSMRLNGTIFADGQSLDLNLALDTKGNCSGKIALNGVGTIDIIKKGSLVYVKGDERFWRTSLSKAGDGAIPPKRAKAFITAFTGRWIKAPQEMARSMGANMCELKTMTKRLGAGGKLHTGMTRGADATAENGQPIAVIYQRDDNDDITTIHVAKKGKPYTLRIQTSGGDIPAGDLHLSDFNKPVDVTPPPAGQILDPTTVSA